MGSNLGDEIDCNSFFDQMDDLIESGEFDSSDCKDYPSIWNDSLFSAVNSASDDFSADLSLPCEDIVQLEWLSTFVEDSYSYGGLTMGKENSCVNNKEPSHCKFLASNPVSVLESSSSSSNSNNSSMIPTPSPCHHGPQRARSKRPRPLTFNPRPVTHLMSPTSSCTKVIDCAPSESDTGVESPMKKIPKKKKLKSSIRSDQNPLTTLVKCMHCEIRETPQWRAGPMGPRTLCNACGVRYKKGQLFPEYRPAASPTFVPSLHSNSHKKVLEMRINN